MAGGDLSRRLVVAAVGIPLAVAAVFAGGWILAVLLAFFAAGAAAELFRLASIKGVRAFMWPGAAASAGFVLIGAARPEVAAAAPTFWLFCILLTVGLFSAAIWARRSDEQPLLVVGVTLFGALLTGGTLVFALFLRHLQLPPALGPTSPLLGGAFVVFALAMTWINDSLAYFIGIRWGRRRLLPAISPKKTVEGALAGFIGASLIGGGLGAAVFQGYFGLPFGPFLGAGAGASIAGAAQLGDLAESHIKRAAGVKDSGGLLPGHGGLLDRCDALFFSLPVAYWYFALVLGLAGSAQ